MNILDQKYTKETRELAEYVFTRLPRDEFITIEGFTRRYPEMPRSAVRKAVKYLLYMQALEVGPIGYKPIGQWGWYA